MVVNIIVAVVLSIALLSILGLVFWDIKDETREFLIKFKKRKLNKTDKNK